MAPRGRGRGRGGTIPFSNPRQETGKSKVVPEKRKFEEEKTFGGSYFYGGTEIPGNMTFRPTAVNYITVEIWHGGSFVKEPPRVDYVGGKCETLKDWDVDGISSIELDNLVKHLGYASFNVWYRHPALGLFNGLRPFSNDKHVLAFLNDVKGHEEIEFFIEHLIEPIEKVLVKEATNGEVDSTCEVERECEVVVEVDSDCEVVEFETESLVGEVVVEVINTSEFDREPVVAEFERETVFGEEEREAVVGEVEREPLFGEKEREHVAAELEREPLFGEEEREHVATEVEREPLVGEVEREDVVPEQVREGLVPEGQREDVVAEVEREDARGGEGYSDEDSLDGDYVLESEEEDSDVSLDDPDYDERWDWTNVLPDSTINGGQNVGDNRYTQEGANDEALGEGVQAASASKNQSPTTFEDFVDEDGCSEDLDSPIPSDTDEDIESRKFPKFKLGEEDTEIKFELGHIFSSKSLFITAVKEYALQAKKSVTLKKNDRKRVVVKCLKGCPFYIRASKYEEHSYFQIVSFIGQHTCHRTSKNRQAKTATLARKFVFTIRHTPNIKVNALVEEARKRWGIVLTRYQAYRAKVKALEMIEGAICEQYQKLRSYAEELLRSNPNSTVKIKSTLGEDGPVFERMYVLLHAKWHLSKAVGH